MAEDGENSARQVEQDEPNVSHHVFDIVAENPQVQHIPDQVHPATMQKHARDRGDKWRGAMDFRGQCRMPKHGGWDGSEPVDE